jgi:glucose/arabinose dehydrogenase
MRGLRVIVAAAAMLLAAHAGGQVVKTEEESFRVVTVVERLDRPWGLAFLPDGRMLVTERTGRLRIVDREGKLMPNAVAGLPKIEEYGQGGLLDVALHPRFAENALVYLSFAEPGEGGHGTSVLRGRLAGAPGDPRLEGVEVIYRQTPKSRTGRHFGSRLVFDRAGFLYVTQGDRGEMERAQELGDLAGKVVRLHDDGRIPKDNPFAGKAGARAEIFTLGNRNVQGAALHPATGELWTHEHGPQGGDEVNVLRAGANYGWPVITYGVNYGTGTKIGEGTA